MNNEMLEKLGKRKYVLPIAIMLALGLLFSLIFYPAINMQIKNIPFAVVNLDEGVTLGEEDTNIGEVVVQEIFNNTEVAEGETAPITWTQLDNKEALDQAISNNEFYGRVVIPKGFTQQMFYQMIDSSSLPEGMDQSAQNSSTTNSSSEDSSQDIVSGAMVAGPDGSARILIFLNVGKSPLISNSMQTALKAHFAEVGIDALIINFHDGTPEGATIESAAEAAAKALENAEGVDAQISPAKSPMSTLMSFQIILYPAVMLSLVVGLLVTRLINLRAKEDSTRKDRFLQLVKQLAASLVFSGCAALTAYLMYTLTVGGSADFATVTLFIWIVSFGLMVFIVGVANFAFGLGALLAYCTVALGMMVGLFPLEVLPEFWQTWVYPWAPQRFVGEGLRAILYLGAGWWNSSNELFAWLALAGVCLSVISALLPAKLGKPGNPEKPEKNALDQQDKNENKSPELQDKNENKSPEDSAGKEPAQAGKNAEATAKNEPVQTGKNAEAPAKNEPAQTGKNAEVSAS